MSSQSRGEKREVGLEMFHNVLYKHQCFCEYECNCKIVGFEVE